jgi:hypothetical protein
MDKTYEKYSEYINSLTNIDNFKSNHLYEEILEHVSYEKGKEYLSLIISQTPFTKEDIINYCNQNDIYGGGKKHNYDFITTSPTNFRYIFHSYLILTHMNSLELNNINIVEVGCGYGGLCLAMSYFSKILNISINSYNLIDLPAISRLQQLYLVNHDINFTTKFHSAFEYGKDIELDKLFLISNYCFSEISKEHQDNYIEKLFPKVEHGFMVWNFIPLYFFGFFYRQEREYPSTGHMNKYLYF